MTLSVYTSMAIIAKYRFPYFLAELHLITRQIRQQFYQIYGNKLLLIIGMMFFNITAQAEIYLVTNNSDAGLNSFRQALVDANMEPGLDTIQFTISGTVVHLTTSAVMDINILPDINDSLLILGNHNTLVASVTGRFFQINSACEIYSLTFDGGQAVATGGAVRTAGAPVCSFTNCTFLNNSAPVSGGAIHSDGDLKLEECTFDNNTADIGGALFIRSYPASMLPLNELLVYNCTFTDNIVTSDGGAIYVDDSKLILKTSTFETTTGTFNQTIALKGTYSSVEILPTFAVMPPALLLIYHVV
ncbi:MAG: hypothetical protein KDC53_20705 [Saprospiraceae bacterium]|nr:hypothetical protein [Saprospiraceae bacterium]